MRKLTLLDCTVSLEVMPEDMPVRGNVMCSDDAAFDKECEDEIIQRINSGDDWAWSVVKVSVEWNGFKGTASLGGCSYKDENDFLLCEGAAMKGEALDDLNARIEKIDPQLAPLRG